MIAVGILALVLGTVLHKGLSQLSLDFFTKARPLFGQTGGIADALVGSALIVGMAMVMAIPIEHPRRDLHVRVRRATASRSALRIVLDVLNGVPAIVVGIFIFGLLVVGRGQSAIFGAFSLAILMLPMVARATQEVLEIVPRSLREASLALGVTRWRTTVSIVLPTAIGGILTGVVIAVARVAGETAPLLFTSSIAANQVSTDVTHALPTLPVSIFMFSESPDPNEQAMGWAAALVLIRVRPRAQHRREGRRGAPAAQERGRLSATSGGSGHGGILRLGRRGEPPPLEVAGEERRGRDQDREHEDDHVPAREPRDELHERADERRPAGIVKIQATRMFPATPQRTAWKPRTAPAPITDPEIVCVVETGKPKCAVPQRIDAHAVCAANPCGGSIFAMRVPERLDDPPAAGVGARGHRERRGGDHPGRRALEVRRRGDRTRRARAR